MSKSITKTWLMLVFVFAVASTAWAQVSVTFNIDMGVAVAKKTYNIGDPVTVAGSFNGWSTSATALTDADGDTVYSVTVDGLTPGTVLNFKFLQNGNWESDPNREYTVPEGGGSFTDFWNRDNVYPSTLTNIDFEFNADMEIEILSGRFSPLTDTLTLRGFNGDWSGAAANIMTKTDDPNVYFISKNKPTYAGETVGYKYAYVAKGATVWEQGDNRNIVVTQGDIDAKVVSVTRKFDDLDPNILLQQPCVVKFTVDMKNAVVGGGNQAGQPFSKIESVGVCGSVPPLSWPGSGWPNSDRNLLIDLNDSGLNGDKVAGDQIWSRDVTFSKYTGLRIEFKYGVNWGLETNGGINDNENAVGGNHILNFPSIYTEKLTVVDTFGNMGASALVDVTTEVKKVDNQIPAVYTLEQNFPNPFNPSTTINFSLPTEGFVSLKVYNALGQEVATLVNQVRAAGNYSASFDASRLTSGMYFYTINANNFTSSKKMMLVK